MNIYWVIWKDLFVEKIRCKHSVTPEEVEELFRRGPAFRKAETGRTSGEDLYLAYGRSEQEGI